MGHYFLDIQYTYKFTLFVSLIKAFFFNLGSETGI